MEFLRVWSTGYTNPARFVERLEGQPAPHWGLYAQLLRALLDSLLLYLPLSLLGRIPPTPSYLPSPPTESYYGALVWLTPLVFTIQWLLGGGVIHLLLRLSGRASDVDQILNLTGMVTLVAGGFLLLWDWIWILAGGMTQHFLGYSHLLIDLWGLVLVVVGLRRALRVRPPGVEPAPTSWWSALQCRSRSSLCAPLSDTELALVNAQESKYNKSKPIHLNLL